MLGKERVAGVTWEYFNRFESLQSFRMLMPLTEENQLELLHYDISAIFIKNENTLQL